ncbi:LacI family DNA-binding transcriptional regulator [Devosia sp. A369]
MKKEREAGPVIYPAQHSQPLNLDAIATATGVSIMTVSRVINHPDKVAEKTRIRVLDAIKDMGFILNRVAGSLAQSASRIVGTVVPPIINTGIAEQVQGMSDMLTAHGYQLIVSPGELTSGQEEQRVLEILGWQPAGLILQAFPTSERVRKLLRERGYPVVEISEIEGVEPIDCVVGISNFQAAYEMTEYLFGRGYRRIGFIGATPHGHDRAARRTLGYRAACETLGLPVLVRIGPMENAFGSNALIELTDETPEIDAIFCASDTTAVGVIFECQRRKWAIPDRLAVAGFGDLEIASQIVPTMTTVRVNRKEMGRQAAATILDRVAGSTTRVVTDIGFKIIQRQST